MLAARAAGTHRRALGSGRQRLLNRGEYVLFSRKPLPILFRDQRLANPHGVLAALAFDQRHVDTGAVLDERGRTGRARAIVSDLAVVDANRLHRDPPRPRNVAIRSSSSPSALLNRRSRGGIPAM